MNIEYNTNLKNEIHNIIRDEKLTTVFQPIANINQQKIFGYEGLIRGPSDSPLQSPEKLFEYATQYGLLLELDYLCRKILIQQFHQLSLPGKLFLNVTPDSLMNSSYCEGETLRLIKKIGMNPNNLVIELTESQPIEQYTLIQKAIEYFKEAGFSIAIDDLGTGYSGLKLWSELSPDFVKIDRFFLNSLHEDKIKRKFVRSIYDIAYSMGCHVIAEGVETCEEYATIRKMGGEYIQGYYFARPQQIPVKKLDSSLFRTTTREKTRNSNHTVKELVQLMPKVSPDSPILDVAEIFTHSPSTQSIAIVDSNDTPLGIISRTKLMGKLAEQFGRSIFSRKPISVIMNQNMLVVDINLALETLSQRLTSSIDIQTDEFIVVEKGRFVGKGSLIDVLKKITEIKVETARYANPLTLLPGNVPIQKHLKQCLENNIDFSIVYCDLDNFKPYNDYYGYGHGDDVLKQLSDILVIHITPEIGFVGHIGGDDFIFFIKSNNWKKICKNILSDFKQMIVTMYNKKDISRGFIKSINREGKKQKFPIMSLSMGVIEINKGHKLNPSDISILSSQAKSSAKKILGNTISYANIKYLRDDMQIEKFTCEIS